MNEIPDIATNAPEFILDELVKKRALRRALKVFAIALFSFSLPFGGLAGYKEVYAEKFLPNTYVGNINLSGKTYKEAREKLARLAETYEKQEYILSDGEGNSLTISPAELGLDIDIEAALAEAYKYGHKGGFTTETSELIGAPFKRRGIDLRWRFTNSDFENVLKEKTKTLETAAENAQVKIENGLAITLPMKIGRQVDLNKLIEDLKKLFPEETALNSKPSAITISFTQKMPPITDEYAKSIAEKINQILSEDFILTYEGRNLTIPKSEIAGWITITPRETTIEVTLDQNKINASLKKIGKGIEKPAKPRKISAKDGSVIEEGEEGLAIDKSKMFSGILGALSLEGEVKHQLPLIVNKVPASEKKVYPEEIFTPGAYPGKYIEINLSKQMLAAFEGENKFMEARVSTGRWSMPTPTGTFSINNKNPRAYSRTYGLYMPWWMSFIGSEYGIHELPEWPNGAKEGESHLGIPVSHGCVRLGVGPAKQLYDWAEIGTIVYIHK